MKNENKIVIVFEGCDVTLTYNNKEVSLVDALAARTGTDLYYSGDAMFVRKGSRLEWIGDYEGNGRNFLRGLHKNKTLVQEIARLIKKIQGFEDVSPETFTYLL